MKPVEIPLRYGHRQLAVRVPEANLVGVVRPHPAETPGDEEAILAEALAHPLGTPPLRDLVSRGGRVAIVTSDLTRPCPSARMLPPLLAELEGAGVRDTEITIILALGLHRPMTEKERAVALGREVAERYRVIHHDPEDTLHLGVTQRGTTVELFRPLVEADVRIALGNVEFHYFAGYSGGAKAVFPGCASAKAVTANHAMMVLSEACAGRLEGNPLREDLEEAADLLGVDFILNVVVDAGHRITAATAGDVTLAHRVLCERVAARGKIPVDAPADIVLASAGGYPQDVNVYQAHKALENASLFIRDGGVLILAAECVEGFGHDVFETWMTDGSSPDELIARIQREFVLGGHKAAAVAKILQRGKVLLVSELPDEQVRKMHMHPFPGMEGALAAAMEEAGRDAHVLVLPEANSVLPSFR